MLGFDFPDSQLSDWYALSAHLWKRELYPYYLNQMAGRDQNFLALVCSIALSVIPKNFNQVMYCNNYALKYDHSFIVFDAELHKSILPIIN